MEFLLSAWTFFVAPALWMIILGVLLGKQDASDNVTIFVLAVGALAYVALVWWLTGLPAGFLGWFWLVVRAALLWGIGMCLYWYTCPRPGNERPQPPLEGSCG